MKISWSRPRQEGQVSNGAAVDTEKPSDRIWLWIRLAIVLVLLFAAIPGPLPPGGSGLDASWIIGINAAHAQGFVFGRDIVWTYGPLGYLLFPMPGLAAPLPAMLMALLPFGVFAFAVLRLCMAKGVRDWPFYVVILFAAWLLAGDQQTRPAIACIACLISALALSRPRVIDVAVLGITSGLSLSIKLNGGALFLAGFVAVAGITVFRMRRSVGESVLLVALAPFFAIFPFLSNGALSVLPQLVAGSRELIGGYSEAMAYEGPLWQSLLATSAFLSFLLIAALVREKRAIIVASVPAALVALYSFKSAIVRQDAHATIFHLLLALAIAIVATELRSVKVRRLVFGFALLNVAAGTWITAISDPQRFARFVDLPNLATPSGYLLSWVEFPRTWAWLANVNQAVFKSMQLPPDFDGAVGGRSVEALGYSIDHVIANAWRWNPRPVMQTYSAYTPYLDQLNAAHVGSTKAADCILLAWGTIDQRHMFLEDPASWVETLSNYRVRLMHPDYSLLERRRTPMLGKAVPFGETVVGWNQEVKLPATRDLLVMHAGIRYSLIGWLRRTLLRATPVFVAVTTASGSHASWRAVQSSLRDGAIINYLPESTAEYALLSGERGLPPEQVTSIHFETEHPSDYAGTIRISWERRPMRSETGSQALAQEKVQLWSAASELPKGVDTKIDRTPEGIRVDTSTNDPQLYFPLKRDLRSFGRIVIRARFQKRDYIDLFFGQQVNGRGIDAMVPLAGKWLDVTFDVSMNPSWALEAGTVIRFDPSSGVRVNAIDIAGVWGVEGPASEDASPVEFRPVTDEELTAARKPANH